MPDALRKPVLGALCLAVMVFVAYAPALRVGYIFDDEQNLLANPTVRSLDGLRRMWFSPQANEQYYPLTYSTFWIEYHLWRLAPLGYHVVNIVLHTVNVLLLWRLLVVLEVPGAWFAAALFAVHPVESESVVWVAESQEPPVDGPGLGGDAELLPLRAAHGWQVCRSNRSSRKVVCTCSCDVWAGAVQQNRRRGGPGGAPGVVLVEARSRDLRDVAYLLPFFATGIALALVTVWVETHHVGAQGDGWALPFVSRILLAGRALWFYVGKLVWPYPLMFFYPRWPIDSHLWWQYLFPLAAVGIAVGLWLARRRFGRGPLAALLIYAGLLAPVLGFFNIYFAQLAQVADHFQYHASAALFALAAAGAALVIGQAPPKVAHCRCCRSRATACDARGPDARRTYFYETPEGFYRGLLAENPTVWCVPQNLGAILHEQGKYEEALSLYTQAIAMNPADTMLYDGAGTILLDWGHRDGIRPERLKEAIAYFREACRLEPRNFLAYRNLGIALSDAQQYDEARAQFQAVLDMYSQDCAGIRGAGHARRPRGRPGRRRGELSTGARHQPAIRGGPIWPGHDAGVRRAFSAGHSANAGVLELEPGDAQVQFEMGNLLARANQPAAAMAHYAEAVRLRPGLAEAWYNLGVLSRNRDVDKSIACFQAALRAKPDYARAKAALDEALAARQAAP